MAASSERISKCSSTHEDRIVTDALDMAKRRFRPRFCAFLGVSLILSSIAFIYWFIVDPMGGMPGLPKVWIGHLIFPLSIFLLFYGGMIIF